MWKTVIGWALLVVGLGVAIGSLAAGAFDHSPLPTAAKLGLMARGMIVGLPAAVFGIRWIREGNSRRESHDNV